MSLAARLRLAAHIVKEDRAIARAAKRMPKPVPWEWARPRLVPLLAGPRFDPPGEELIRSVAGPGCAIEFGIDLGGVFPVVDASVAERWECSADQLRDMALANLRQRVTRIGPRAAAAGTLSGRIVRLLRQPRGLAASCVFLLDELTRLFGSHDQVLAAPSRSLLVSFPMNTPAEVLADAVVDLEMGEPLPLLLDPFVLLDGELHWQPGDEDGSFVTDS
jgi:hypothetical protein